MAASDIEWTEATWNPIAGCSVLSPGCTNCYAMRMASRLQAMGMTKYAGTTRKSGKRHVWTGRVNIDANALGAPLTWKKPQRIFVNSMSDLFQDKADVAVIRQVWRVMERADWHSFQVLTKRPERMLDLLSKPGFPILANVWLGTSVESDGYLERIDWLRRVPARIRFISFEPLLGSIVDPDLTGIHWVIVGGESGRRARPMQARWVEELRDACQRQGVAFFSSGEQTSLVGSIGVLFEFPNFTDLLDKIGVKVESIKSSPLKASPSGFEPTSPEARAAIESIIKDFYAWFKNLVQERRHLTDDQLAAVDDGRVFTGHQGLDLKLIDQIGDERTAIAWLEKEKNITANLPVRDYRLHSRLDDLPFLHAAALAMLDAVGLDGLARRFGGLGGASALDRFNLDGLLALWQPDGAN